MGIHTDIHKIYLYGFRVKRGVRFFLRGVVFYRKRDSGPDWWGEAIFSPSGASWRYCPTRDSITEGLTTQRGTQRQQVAPFASVWLIWTIFAVHLTFGRFTK
jgi:hypothetical protein